VNWRQSKLRLLLVCIVKAPRQSNAPESSQYSAIIAKHAINIGWLLMVRVWQACINENSGKNMSWHLREVILSGKLPRNWESLFRQALDGGIDCWLPSLG